MAVQTYTVAEAAQMLGVGEWWLAQAARQGKVPHLHLGRKRLFTQQHLDEIMRNAERTPAPAPAVPLGMSRASARRRGLI